APVVPLPPEAATIPPAEESPEEVVVEPVPTDEELATETGGVAGTSKGKRHKDAIANIDGDKETTVVGGPVSTVIVGSCDADGDGVADVSCAGGSTTGIEQAEQAPQPVVKRVVKRPSKKASRGSSKSPKRKK
ncbi:MAG: hypothetical protein M3O25_10180, partial [Actinomycetota bacterium]|nr:hypothetical protein [Actinomycetota bacterium]